MKSRRAFRVLAFRFLLSHFCFSLDRNLRLDRRMGIIAFQGEILELEGIDVFYSGIDFHDRQRPRLARKLELCLLDRLSSSKLRASPLSTARSSMNAKTPCEMR